MEYYDRPRRLTEKCKCSRIDLENDKMNRRKKKERKKENTAGKKERYNSSINSISSKGRFIPTTNNSRILVLNSEFKGIEKIIEKRCSTCMLGEWKEGHIIPLKDLSRGTAGSIQLPYCCVCRCYY